MSKDWRKLTPQRRAILFREQAGCCVYCGGRIVIDTPDVLRDDFGTIDHIIPVSKGGRRTRRSNMALACRQCNQLKRDLPLIVFMAHLWSQTAT